MIRIRSRIMLYTDHSSVGKTRVRVKPHILSTPAGGELAKVALGSSFVDAETQESTHRRRSPATAEDRSYSP